MLRLINIVAGSLIVGVVGIVIGTVSGYANNLRKARDEVGALNMTLEKRVEDRTAELMRARDRAEVLLAEVNHRVANSLSLVGALVTLQSNATDNEAARAVLEETQARIYAVSLVHRSLYTLGDARFVDLDEYFRSLCEHLAASMRDAGHHATLTHKIDPIRLPTDRSINLGIVATEWITNAFKYAYPGGSGEVRVVLRRPQLETVELLVADDGIGRGSHSKPRGTGLGTKLVQAMASSMGASVAYEDGNPGTTARLLVPSPGAEKTGEKDASSAS
jgi:two-component sensor histidine kinase